MLETWRWFGPLDDIGLDEIIQTGASGVVTALHEVPYGQVWERKEIAARKALVEKQPGLEWAVVESLPVHEDIKRGEGDLGQLFANYRQSLANLAAEGMTAVCYNFMPLLDWTRTQLNAPLATGGHALRFDVVQMAAFDCYMLGRDGAEADFSAETLRAAQAWFDQSDRAQQDALLNAIMSGLPGAYDRFAVAELRDVLVPWDGVSASDLRANMKRFLQEIVPTAEELGIRLCVHPDDPPRPLLGLPRIVSSENDIAEIFEMYDSDSNGLTLCTGSLGANPQNDPVQIAKRFAHRVHFAHLRNVAKEADGSFQEAAHLDGDTDLPAVIDVLLSEEARRRKVGRADAQIPMRPDHGHALCSDLDRNTHPGYPLVGRLRGLAELRGVIAGLEHMRRNG